VRNLHGSSVVLQTLLPGAQHASSLSASSGAAKEISCGREGGAVILSASIAVQISQKAGGVLLIALKIAHLLRDLPGSGGTPRHFRLFDTYSVTVYQLFDDARIH